jgi:[ribosomal protein S5]-alanine N-acetyltransferase
VNPAGGRPEGKPGEADMTNGGRHEGGVSLDTVVLEGERLVLREFREDDFPTVHAYGSDPGVVQHLPWGPNTEADTRRFLARAQCYRAAEPRVSFELAVVLRGAQDPIGGLGLHQDGSNAVLGYVAGRSAWGRGLASEAARLMMDFGFRHLNVHRIWAVCDAKNTPAAAVLRKIGMRQEGHLREAASIRGEWRDSLMFAILESEWTPLG